MELKPCKCGADIMDTFEVQLAWKGMRYDIFVAYCRACRDVVPLKAESPYESSSINSQAIEAWNTRV